METVKLRIPIEDAVRERVKDLRRSGVLLETCCPFHDEKTPSFKVDPRRGTWHCYGACGAGGDVLSFVQRFDGVSFSEALDLLATRAGVELPRDWQAARTGEDRSRYEPLFGALGEAQEIYQRFLRGADGAEARTYLERRGLVAQTVEAFGLGLAPDRGNPLTDRARRAGRRAVEAFVAAGLVRTSEGRSYDFFRGRLMIPIRDEKGRIVGFGGRKLTDDPEGPKYVNTPETPLFHKGRLIYGLDRALASVRRERHLFLVEGYTDVMAAHQVGLGNVVAVLGTSTTEDHAALVRRTGARRVTLVFDGDEAGRRASLRALAGLLALPIEIDVLRLPVGEDPCDILVREGAGGLTGRMEGALGWLAFAASGVKGTTGVEFSEGVDEILRLVQVLPKPVQRAESVSTLAHLLDLPAEAVRLQAKGLHVRRGATAPREARSEVSREAPPDAVPGGSKGADRDLAREIEAYRQLVGAVLLDNSLIPAVIEHFDACPDPRLSAILRVVSELYENGDVDDAVDATLVMSALGDDPARDLVVPLEERARTGETSRMVADGAVRCITEISAWRLVAERKQVHSLASDESASSQALLAIWKTHQQRLNVPEAGTRAHGTLIPRGSHVGTD